MGTDGCRHFDSHAYRTSDYADVLSFARGSMRTYEVLAEKAARWNADAEIQGLLRTANVQGRGPVGSDQAIHAGERQGVAWPPRWTGSNLAKAPLPYELLDQLTMEILYGVR